MPQRELQNNQALVSTYAFCLVTTVITLGSLFPFNFRIPADYVWDTLTMGAPVYSDRNYIYTYFQSSYADFYALRTKNDDKYFSGEAFLTFNVSEPVTVYVAHARSPDIRPRWLRAWKFTGDRVHTSDRILYVYKKPFDTKKVSLEGNETGGSMYTVLLGPQKESLSVTRPVSRGLGPWEAFLSNWDRPTSFGDMLSNIVAFALFAYFGVMAMKTHHGWLIISIGLALSLGLQIAQIYLPSRDPNLQDVAWNLIGIIVGTLLAPLTRRSSK